METNSYLLKAGRLVTFMAWLNIIVSIIIIVIMSNNDMSMQNNSMASNQYVIILSIAIPSSILALFVGKALKNTKTWAKAPAVFLALLSFISPPLGTIIAIFLFYYLYKGWREFTTSDIN